MVAQILWFAQNLTTEAALSRSGQNGGIWDPSLYKPWNVASLLLGTLIYYMTILVPLGSCNKIIQTSWLKTTEVYSITVLEARSPNSNQISRVLLPLKSLEENHSLPLPTSSGCWHSLWLYHSNLCLYLHITVSSVCLYLLFYVCLIKTPAIGFKALPHIILRSLT